MRVDVAIRAPAVAETPDPVERGSSVAVPLAEREEDGARRGKNRVTHRLDPALLFRLADTLGAAVVVLQIAAQDESNLPRERDTGSFSQVNAWAGPLPFPPSPPSLSPSTVGGHGRR